jgi:FixJ family two-component response regulator
MNQGAITLLEKPLSRRTLGEAIHEAIDKDLRRRSDQERRAQSQLVLATLSPAERDVLELLVQGKANKCIAQALGISEQKVASRRRQVFEKTHSNSIAALMRLVLEARCGIANQSHVA